MFKYLHVKVFVFITQLTVNNIPLLAESVYNLSAVRRKRARRRYSAPCTAVADAARALTHAD